MGSRSYLGGSTVVNGGWVWSGGSGLSRPKKKKTSIQASKNENFNKKLSKLSDIEFNLLHNVIDSELNNIVIKKINKKTMCALSSEIEKKGGIYKWAQFHPQYKELKIRKKAKKVAKQKPNWIRNVNGLTFDERRDRLVLRDRRSRLLRKIAKSNNTKNMKLSDNERRSFINEISQKSSLIEWAESQSQYKKIIINLER
jgi:hypothetical protein